MAGDCKRTKGGPLMPKLHYPPTIILAILAISGINSGTLYKSWLDTPAERFSWLFLVIWLLPVFIGQTEAHTYTRANFNAAALSVLCLLFSYLGSLNTAAYIGLALAFAATLPWSPAMGIWLCAAIAWMPGFGWLLMHLLPGNSPLSAQLLRLLITASATYCWMRYGNTFRRSDNEQS